MRLLPFTGTWTGYYHGPKEYVKESWEVTLDTPPEVGGTIPLDLGGKESCWRIRHIREDGVLLVE